jgi:hypothetical protein
VTPTETAPRALVLAAIAAAALGAPPRTAAAQDEPSDGEAAREPEPADERARPAAPPLVLAKGAWLVAGSTLNINLSADDVGEPVSLAPSVWYGWKSKLTIGLTHDNGTTPWSPRPAILTLFGVDLMGNPEAYTGGGGICLSGEDGNCLDPYSNVGFDALYSLRQGGTLSLAGHPGLDLATFSPFAVQLRLGVLGRYAVKPKISVVFDPRLVLGVTERESNKTAIDLPFWVWYAVNSRFGVYAHTGIAGSFDGFGDVFRIPLQVGASLQINAKIGAGVDFGFTSLFRSSIDGRALGIRVTYAK